MGERKGDYNWKVTDVVLRILNGGAEYYLWNCLAHTVFSEYVFDIRI